MLMIMLGDQQRTYDGPSTSFSVEIQFLFEIYSASISVEMPSTAVLNITPPTHIYLELRYPLYKVRSYFIEQRFSKKLSSCSSVS